MGMLSTLYHSSVGKKFVMGLTGFFLCSFLIVHVSGNLLLFLHDDGKAFNAFGEFMSTNVVIRTLEIVLFAGFIGHILTGTIVWLKNRAARPQKYVANAAAANSTWMSRTMFLTGSIVFVFLVIHIRTFWVTARFAHEENPSMYEVVRASLSDPSYAALYIVAVALLAFHLRHGFQSAFQTFGLKDQRYAPFIHLAGMVFWLLIPLAFIAMPVYFVLNP
jgi:succinate dehydrogenase / fumarate reductase cytochrome b subunit